MITLREEFEQAVIVRLVAVLKRVHEDKASTGFQYAREFTENDAAHPGRQFMEHEDARYRVLALVRQRNRFRIAHHKGGSRPTV